MMKITMQNNRGFNLIEMAVVLVILGLLIAGLTLPLTAQIDQRNYSETKKELQDIREAIIGYAFSSIALDGKPYLPCPDTNNDGIENREAAGICTNAEGAVPWATLGVGRQDAWGNPYIYRVALTYANSNVGFTLTTPKDILVLSGVGGSPVVTSVPAVVLSKGKAGAGADVDELENSDADATFVSREVSAVIGAEFDDVVTWLPTSILASRMVSAGRLP